jgi:hypothetical protein
MACFLLAFKTNSSAEDISPGLSTKLLGNVNSLATDTWSSMLDVLGDADDRSNEAVRLGALLNGRESARRADSKLRTPRFGIFLKTDLEAFSITACSFACAMADDLRFILNEFRR